MPLRLNREALKQIFSLPLVLGGVFTALAVVVFCINFWLFHGSLPGYKFIFYPGIAFARFFSEEIDFLPKLGIMVSGQFLTCFLMTLIIQGLIRNNIKRRVG